MPRRLLACCSGLLLVFTAPHLAGADETAVVLPDTVRFELNSSVTGHRYRIDLAWPASPDTAPAEGWPVLIVLDGSRTFVPAATLLRQFSAHALGTGVGPGVVIGVDYPVDTLSEQLKARTADLLPADDRADRFRQFLLTELLDAVAARVPIHREARTLYGHSYAGLFAAHTLLHQPDAFTTFLIASPSLWWNDRAVLAAEVDFPARLAATNARPRIQVTSAEYEAALPPHLVGTAIGRQREPVMRERAMVELAAAFAARLQSLGLDCRAFNYPRANHGSAAALALIDGLSLAFPTPALPTSP